MANADDRDGARNTNTYPAMRRGRPSPRSSSRSSVLNVSFRDLQRRQPAGDRINDILEIALERAGTMGSGSSSPRSPGSRSPVTSASRPPPHANFDDEAPPADETTGIAAHSAGPSYQTVQPAPDSSVRSRKSIYSRDPQPSPQPEPSLGAREQSGATHNGTVNGAREPTPPWWRKTLDKFRSVELENKGSVARDHLALERTFLAWLRTSLAFASIGIAVTQLFRLNTSLSSDESGRMAKGDSAKRNTLLHLGRPLGATFLGISILILILGYRRYFVAQGWVIEGKFPASRGTIIVVSIVAFALMALSLVVVIVIQPAADTDL